MSSELKVDTISEKTSASGVTIDSVLVKDGIAHSGLVKLASTTASDDATVVLDNFVDKTNYSVYKVVINNLIPVTNDREFRVVFRSGGASGANVTGTYYRAGYYAYASTSGTGSTSNTSYTNYGTLTGAVGNVAGEGITATGILSVANGTTGTNWIELSWVYKNDNEHIVKDNEIIGIKETTAVTGLQFQFDSGNVSSGTIDIYGYKV